MIRVGLDIVSGEHDPSELLAGVLEVIKKNKEVKLFVIGDQKRLSDLLKDKKYDENLLSIMHASEVILMTDDPTTICRKKTDSSLMVGLQALKNGEIDCFFSPGNTGATLAGSLLTVGRIPGIKRPAIACPLPTAFNKKVALFLDGGANVDCLPVYLKQFAQMGSIYYHNNFGVKKPRIGLLNVGEEKGKGNLLTKQAFAQISQTSLNFVGNIEPKEFFEHHVDVAICDGFIGNIFLKTVEGAFNQMAGILADEVKGSLIKKIGGYLMLQVFRKVKKEMNPNNYGAAPLLGVAKPVFIGHGKTNRIGIINAVQSALQFINTNCIDIIQNEVTD